MPHSLSEAIALSWTIPPWPTLTVLIAGFLYARGWRVARTTRPRELPFWRAVCFFAGLLFFWVALASPLDALDEFLLVAHMTQHLLLMSIAPPLILLGNPVVPMLRGLPRGFVSEELSPWMNSGVLHWFERLFTSPAFGWISMDVAVVLWHIPAAYELALRSNFWHQIEHSCFFLTSLAFWWYVVRPWPNRIRSSRWLVIPYVASAHLILFFVGLIIAFAPGVVYPTYGHVPRLFGIGVMTDQALAGGEMIFVGLVGIIFTLVPIMLQLLSEPSSNEATVLNGAATSKSAPVSLDLLQTRVTGFVLRSRYGRRFLQASSIVVVAAVILDGLFGVQVAPMNLAGAVVWNIVRPVNLILLLFVANVFCMACPFTLPRELVRRLGMPQLRWPERLSTKWPAAGMMLVFFWSYEEFSLWKSPRDTALLLITYVVAATVINSVFRDASFCKYVCPVGQFNFIASLIAPLELGVRSQSACSSCATHDCVRGNEDQHGCELKLYLPNKTGNFDCTLCMDCVKACPQDNISLTIQSPLRELARDPARSSVGRISARPDIAVLILVVVFSSIANAAIMIAPVTHLFDDFQRSHPWAGYPVLSLLRMGAICAILLLLYLGFSRMLQRFTEHQMLRTVFCRFSFALLPLGLAIWLAHLLFHLASSWPVVPMLVKDISARMFGENSIALSRTVSMPMKMMAASSSSMSTSMTGANGWNLFDLQIWIVNLGLFVCWYAGLKLIRQLAASDGRSWWMSALWGAGSVSIYAAAIWIFSQPMYMRGLAI